jgi:hypothetical protein
MGTDAVGGQCFAVQCGLAAMASLAQHDVDWRNADDSPGVVGCMDDVQHSLLSAVRAGLVTKVCR